MIWTQNIYITERYLNLPSCHICTGSETEHHYCLSFLAEVPDHTSSSSRGHHTSSELPPLQHCRLHSESDGS